MIRTLTESLKEAKEAVKAVDALMEEVSKMKLSEIFKAGFAPQREYRGDVVKYDSKVVITQEVMTGADVDVEYAGNSIIIRFDGKEYKYDVGCVKPDTIKAVKKVGILTVEAERCEDAGEDKKSVQEE